MSRLQLGVVAAYFAFAGAVATRAASNSEAGAFSITTYSAKTFSANPQNWAIGQDSRGVMYFGNTDAILEYDGVSWRRTALDNGSAVKALSVDASGTVYAGGQGAFGYLAPDPIGKMQFVSLIDRIPLADHNFGYVLKALSTLEGTYFSSDHRLFRISSTGRVDVWSQKDNLKGVLFSAFGKVYVSSSASGLLALEGNRLVPCPWGSRFAHDRLVAASSSGNDVLLATSRRLYRWRGNSIEPFRGASESYLAEHEIVCIGRSPAGDIVVGTRRGGAVLLDAQGEVDRILDKRSSLPSDFVTALFPDRQGNLWIATNNGLAQFNPALTHFDESSGIHGNVYSISRLKGTMYAGTTAGLYRMLRYQDRPPLFEPVNAIENTIWAMKQRGDLSLIASQTGLYSVSENRVSQILHSDLVYDLSFSPRDPSIVYAAGHDGILVLQRHGSTWNTIAKQPGAGQDFRTVAEAPDGRVWATTQVDIWRIDFHSQPAKIERFDARQGVPRGWKNVYPFRGSLVFATAKGLLKFSEPQYRFVPDIELGTPFSDGSKPVSVIQQDAANNVWITGEGYHDLLRPLSSSKTQRMGMPLLGSGIEEIWALHVDADGTAWASGSDGVLYRWDPSRARRADTNFQVLIRRVNVAGAPDALFEGGGALPSPTRVPFRDHALRFEFAAPFYEQEAGVQYQVRLEGTEKEWSPWNSETRKDYTNLPPHNYLFRVRARNPHGQVSPEGAFRFRVLPPWYRTWWAYTLYALAILLSARFGFHWRVRVLEAKNRKLEEIVLERTIEVRAQRDQNEALLLNILPAPVARELRDSGAVTPMAFDDVTVCFSDFKEFTLSSEKLPHDKLVSTLNEYFTAFDEVMDRYGLEKLKTIGDSYMFAGGLPKRCSSHALDAVLAAFEMLRIVRDLARPAEGIDWQMRIGLYSGPVVAGVVGKRKFAFDIWGSTVNLASRMESSGVPNHVNLSSTTYDHVHQFIDCEPRGCVRIKGGRELEMHLARGPMPNVLRGPVTDGIPAAFRASYQTAFGHPPRSFPEFLLAPEPAATADIT